MPGRKSKEEVQEVLALYDRLLNRRSSYEGMWTSIASLMRPTRIDIRTRRAPGSQQNHMIFDGTAVKASNDLASALSGSMTPVEFPWFSLKMRAKELNEDYDVQMWLEDTAKRMHLALQQSNFGSEMHELYLDLITFGTGCIYVEERPMRTPYFNGFQFTTVAPGRYVVLEGPDGLVNAVMRVFKMTAKACVDLWGKENLSIQLLEVLEKKSDTLVELLHVVQPYGAGVLSDRRRYESNYYEFEHKHHITGSYHRKLRFLVPRWTKTSDEEYGRGQGHVAFPDTASLNRAIEMRFKQWALAIDPPLVTVDDGVIGKIKRTPGTRITVRNLDAIRELESKARFDVAQFSEADLRAAIKNYFFSDQLQLPAKQYMTAYEIQAQVEIMQRLLGPTIGRVKHELLSLLLDNAFDLMQHAGALMPPPPVLLEAASMGAADVDIEYEAPLTRAQRANDLVAIDKAVMTSRPFIEMNPDSFDNFDSDKIVRFSAEQTGVPTSLMRPLEVVAQIRAQKAKEKAEQEALMKENMQADSLNKGASGVSKLAPTMAEMSEGGGGGRAPLGGKGGG